MGTPAMAGEGKTISRLAVGSPLDEAAQSLGQGCEARVRVTLDQGPQVCQTHGGQPTQLCPDPPSIPVSSAVHNLPELPSAERDPGRDAP